MRLATTTRDFSAYTQNQAEAITWISEGGFRCVDYSFGLDRDRKSGVFGDDFEGYIHALKAHAERLGVSFVQAHAPSGKPFLRGWEELTEQTILSVRACAALGIPNLVVHSAYAPGMSKEETIEKNKAFYLPILRAAEQYRVCILTENFNKMTREDTFWIDNATDLLTLIEYVDHPMLHAVWDTGHANLQDIPQDESLRLLGNHVRALHVHDNLGDDDTHLPPYSGTLNMDSLMKGLADIGYSGYFTFEVGSFFHPSQKRRQFAGEDRLLKPSLQLRKKAEELLFEIGKSTLSAYGRFEA